MKNKKEILGNNFRENLVKNSEKGIIKTTVIIVIAILIISYFDINMKEIFESTKDIY